MIKKEAAQSAFRMLDSFILIGLTRNNGLDQHAYSDNMPIRYDFEASFEVNYTKGRDGTTFLPNRVYLLIIQMALGKMG
jgi:hypothetical protein